MQNETKNDPKSGEGLSFLDGIFILLLAVSFLELFFYGDIASKLESGKFVEQKPSWSLFSIIVLILGPYKEFIYLSTVVVGLVLLIRNVYKKFRKKNGGE